MMKQISFVFLLVIGFSCASDQFEGDVYQPIGLRKLSVDEIVHRITNSEEYNASLAVIKDSEGNEIPKTELMKIDEEKFFADQYVDENGVLKEVVIRPIRRSDRKAIEKIKQAEAALLESSEN